MTDWNTASNEKDVKDNNNHQDDIMKIKQMPITCLNYIISFHQHKDCADKLLLQLQVTDNILAIVFSDI